MSRPDYDFGDVIEWLGNPVMVLGRPFQHDANGNPLGGWLAPVAYLSRYGRQPSSAVRIGQRLERFQIEDKLPWKGELNDEQARLYGVLLLTEGRGK